MIYFVIYMDNLVVNQSSAYLKYVRISPFKIRRVLDQIRGRSYSDAVLILKFMPYKSCSSILKVLNSAASNAKFKFNTNSDVLFVLEARVDSNSYLKRIRPHAQGRGFPIKKRMSNIISRGHILSNLVVFSFFYLRVLFNVEFLYYLLFKYT